MILRGIALDLPSGPPGATQHAFTPGYSVIPGDAQSADLLAAGLCSILYPDSRAEPSLGATGRLIVQLQATDGTLRQIERDLATDTTVLSAGAPGGGLTRVGANPAEIGQQLRTEERLPTFGVFREIFLGLAAAGEPAGEGSVGGEGGQGGGGSAGVGDDEPQVVPAAHLAGLIEAAADAPAAPAAGGGERLRALREELTAARRAEELEYELEGLRQELFKLEERRAKVAELEARFRRIEEQLAQLPQISAGGDAAEQRLVELQQRKARLEDELSRLARDHQRVRTDTSERPWSETLRDPGVVGGAALGLLFLVIALLIGGGARYLILGSMLGFGVTAISLWRFVGEQERRAGSGGQLHVLEDRWQRGTTELEQLEAEAQTLGASQDGYSSEDRAKVREEHQRLSTLRDDLSTRLQGIQGSQVYQQLETRRQELESQQATMEAELSRLADAAVSGTTMDIEREIAQLEAQPGGATSSAAPAADAGGELMEGFEPTAFGADDAPPAAAAPGTPATAAAPLDPLLPVVARAAADIFFSDAEELLPRLLPRMSALLAAFTGGAWTGVQLSPEGGCAALVGPGGTGALDRIPPADHRRLTLAARVALVEAALEVARAPLLLGAELDGVADPRTALNPLAGLVRSVQLVHVTADARYHRPG